MDKINDKLNVTGVKAALMQYYDEEKARVLPTFFKTGIGEYGEGDVFLGIAVPNIRKVARECRAASMKLVGQLLTNKYHECRVCALFILNERFQKSRNERERKAIFQFYLSHANRINNWDLVDCSAHIIVGGYLADKPRDVLYTLLADDLLWNKRIAVVACLAFIRKGDFADIFRLTRQLLDAEPKPHDLMQKACGWMLREVGKKGGMEQLEAFLDELAATMPRTMLRYAIEHFSPDARLHYMALKDHL